MAPSLEAPASSTEEDPTETASSSSSSLWFISDAAFARRSPFVFPRRFVNAVGRSGAFPPSSTPQDDDVGEPASLDETEAAASFPFLTPLWRLSSSFNGPVEEEGEEEEKRSLPLPSPSPPPLFVHRSYLSSKV